MSDMKRITVLVILAVIAAVAISTAVLQRNEAADEQQHRERVSEYRQDLLCQRVGC